MKKPRVRTGRKLHKKNRVNKARAQVRMRKKAKKISKKKTVHKIKSVLHGAAQSAPRGPGAQELMEENIRIIRVMPALPAESLEKLRDVPETKADNALKIIEEEIAPETVFRAETLNREPEERTAPPALLPEKEEQKIPVREKSERFEFVKDLTAVQISSLLFLPLTKLYGALYWSLKLRYIQRQNKKEKRESSETSADEFIDVFALPKRAPFFIVAKEWTRRVSVAVLLVAILLGIPVGSTLWYVRVSAVKDKILELSYSAVDTLRKGERSIKNFDLAQAASDFEKSKRYFESARKEFLKLGRLTRGIAQNLPKTGDNIKTAFLLLEAGKTVAEAGEAITKSTHSLFSPDPYSGDDILKSYIEKLVALEENLNFALPRIAQAKIRIDNIDSQNIPAANLSAFYDVKEALPVIEGDVSDMSQVIDSLLHILGYDQWQRYLLIFQNNNELRATGGFMGSFALVEIDRGKITNIEIPPGGTYDLQGSLLAQVMSPRPFHIINPIWQMQDSNWWPDFTLSAPKIMWFYDKSQGPSVDGVITLTSSVMEKILEVTGSIEMEKYGRVMTSENFTQEAQKIVELEYDKTENKPKQFIADLAPKVIERILQLEGQDVQRLLKIFYEGLREKQLLLYSGDKRIEQMILDLDWGGKQKIFELSDYLSVINTNIAGGKTDGVVKNILNHKVRISPEGEIYATLEITRSHTGVAGSVFEGVQNNSYVRIYVPKGSSYISSDGFTPPAQSLYETPPTGYGPDEDMKNIEGEHFIDPINGTESYTENGKTVFANWLMVKPGENLTARVEYKLPFTLSDAKNIYSFTIQKQPGDRNTQFQSSVYFSENYSVKEAYPELSSSGMRVDRDSLTVTGELATDRFYGIVFETEP